MSEYVLNAKVREEIGRSESRRMRRAGELPAVVYGKKNAPLSLKLNEIEVLKSVRKGLHPNTLLEVKIDAKGDLQSKTVLVKEIQRNVITQKLLHIDFNEVALDEEIKAHIPVESVGEPIGVKDGGVLESILHELEVACLPMDLPETINIDVSALAIGDSIHVKDIVVSEKVRILNDPELTVFAVAAPKIEEEPVAAAAGAEGKAEPELVAQKGKKEEEGEEGAAPAEGAKKEGKKEPEKKAEKKSDKK